MTSSLNIIPLNTSLHTEEINTDTNITTTFIIINKYVFISTFGNSVHSNSLLFTVCYTEITELNAIFDQNQNLVFNKAV